MHADDLAGHAGYRGVGDTGIFLGDKARRRRVVLVGEIDFLLALLGNGHGRDDSVVLAGHQSWNHAIPALGNDFAARLDPFAERLGDVDIETAQLTVFQVTERRISALGSDAQ
ncbi:hypothetical protein D3C76_1607090 [compost metagenome]